MASHNAIFPHCGARLVPLPAALYNETRFPAAFFYGHRYDPAALRWFLLGTQYRSPVNYSTRALEEASDRVFYLLQALVDADAALANAPLPPPPPAVAAPAGEAGAGQAAAARAAKEAAAAAAAAAPAAAFLAAVEAALADDLNTPVVLAEAQALLKVVNELLPVQGKAAKAKAKQPAARAAGLKAAVRALRGALGGILGLPVAPAEASEALRGLRACALARAGMDESSLAERLAARVAARAAKDYAQSDLIRVELAARGIGLMDGGDGTGWRPVMVISSSD